MKLSLLRNLLMLDSAILFLLGAALIFAPGPVMAAFHFKDVPSALNYLVGLWGCVLITLAWGYAVAATNPLKHKVWIQVAVARGLLECVLGLVYWQQGLVSFAQAGFGIILALLVTIAYLLLYPRKSILADFVRAKPGVATKP